MNELSYSPSRGNGLNLSVHGDTAESAGAVKPSPPQDDLSGQLIDRYGHLHSEAIFSNWSPAAIKAMGIRRVEAEGGAQ